MLVPSVSVWVKTFRLGPPAEPNAVRPYAESNAAASDAIEASDPASMMAMVVPAPVCASRSVP